MFGNIYNASLYATQAADPLSAVYQSMWSPAASQMGMFGAAHPSLGLAHLGGASTCGAQGVTPHLFSQCPSPYAFAQFAGMMGTQPALTGLAMQQPHLQPFSLAGPATGQFGARGTPFNIAAGGNNVVAELQEIGKDLMVDRARDFHHLEIINDLVDARCHGRQLDTVIQALVSGIPVPQHLIAQILVRERQIDHAADNVIRTIVNETKYNRRADEILANLVSGRPHLRRYDETLKNHKDDAFDAVIDAKAAQICTAAAGGHGWLPLSRNRAEKQLMAIRELMIRSPIAGTPGLNAILSIAPVAMSLRAAGTSGAASLIDKITAGGCTLGSVIAAGGPQSLIGGPHLGGLGAFSSFSPLSVGATGFNPIHSAAFNPLFSGVSSVNPLVGSGFGAFENPIFGMDPLTSAVNPMVGSWNVNPILGF